MFTPVIPDALLLCITFAEHIEIVRELLNTSTQALHKSNLLGDTPLHNASQQGSLPAVKLLVERGALVDVPNRSQMTPLHLALYRGHTEVASFLWANFPESLAMATLTSLLPAAAACGAAEIATELLKKGACFDPNDNSSRSPFFQAVWNGQQATIDLFRAITTVSPLKHPTLNSTLLHAAAQGGVKPLVLELLSLGYDPNGFTLQQETPLLIAAKAGHQDIVDILLHHGATITTNDWKLLDAVCEGGADRLFDILFPTLDLKKAPSQELGLLLNKAAKKGRVRYLKSLASAGAPIDTKLLAVAIRNGAHEEALLRSWISDQATTFLTDADARRDLLIASVVSNCLEILRFLLENDARVTGSCFEVAAIWNRKELIDEWIKGRRAGTQTKRYLGKALLQAVCDGNYDMTVFLIVRGASVAAKDSSGRTPLHLAVMAGRPDIAELLLAHGANVNAQSADGMHPIHLLPAGTCGISPLDLHLSKFDSTKFTALFSLLNKAGATYDHFVAAGLGDESYVERFVDANPERVNNADGPCGPMIHWAAASGHCGVIDILLQYGADINLRDRDGTTAIHQALQADREDVAIHLLDRGAEILGIHDSFGWSVTKRFGFRFRAFSEALQRRGHVVPRLQELQLEEAVKNTTTENFESLVTTCTQCSDLVSTRTQTICGRGATKPVLVCIIDAPSEQDDSCGKLLSGPEGGWLDRIMKYFLFDPDEVYVMPLIRCAPVDVKGTAVQHQEKCRRFLDHHLNMLDPQGIVVFGQAAARGLFRTWLPLERLRGKVYTYQGRNTIATHDLRDLERAEKNPGPPAWNKRSLATLKNEIGQDFRLILSLLGRKGPEPTVVNDAGKKQG